MQPEKSVIDRLKQVEISDLRVLLIGLILLIMPIVVLIYLSSSSKSQAPSYDHLKLQTTRSRVFNFPSEAPKQEKSQPSFFTRQPATLQERITSEIESVSRIVEMSERPEVFPPGTSEETKQIYRAEHHPLMRKGNAYFDEGNLADAEKAFEQALQEGGDNIFQQVYAVSGLIAVYELTGEQDKLEKAFSLYVELISEIPPEYGGGDLKLSLQNAYGIIKTLSENADSDKVIEAFRANELSRHITEADFKASLKTTLDSFPVKFD